MIRKRFVVWLVTIGGLVAAMVALLAMTHPLFYPRFRAQALETVATAGRQDDSVA